ncbi:MAG: hypothetical protein ACE5EH_08185 [Gammaproteobacteria bacterium]
MGDERLTKHVDLSGCIKIRGQIQFTEKMTKKDIGFFPGDFIYLDEKKTRRKINQWFLVGKVGIRILCTQSVNKIFSNNTNVVSTSARFIDAGPNDVYSRFKKLEVVKP